MRASSDEHLHVEALGVTFAVSAEDPRLRRLAGRAWAAASTEPRDGCPVVKAPDLDADADDDDVATALQLLTQLITYRAIAARAGHLTMFHAGGLCDQVTGATVALVAPGGTGKTTAIRTLGHGRGYVTDETVGLASDGSIVPYCKPLSIRRPDDPGLKDEVSPLALGLSPPSVPPWLAGIVLLRRDREPGRGVLIEDVDILDALVLLAPETSSLYRFDRPLHHLAAIVQSVGGLRRVRYHDAQDLEPLVDEIVGRSR
ncbi:hypothetical protein ASH01_15865 [Terrabacter sp. Soil811]|uniref:hypothetical protein n=1 Tax=Terrabacter sp. Soil811 TaxID=1736419 RepID=UPI0006F26E07|nr:hypothetical protein [Terrabacter sp. Soil811]KRF43274.1 hypothetical protein ASH01_15865 [Terrabacter sp. Soil811]